MAVEVESVDGKVLLRVGTPQNHTCVEIALHELPDAIRALVSWYAWTDNRAAGKLVKSIESMWHESSEGSD